MPEMFLESDSNSESFGVPKLGLNKNSTSDTLKVPWNKLPKVVLPVKVLFI